MANSYDPFLKEFDANGPPPIQIMEDVEHHFGCTLPADYKDFMSVQDGGEGFIGGHYLILWRSGELIEFNRDYEVVTYAPGLLLFGSNGGGEAFAFDIRPSEEMKIRMVPFIGMSLKDAKPLANTFEAFFNRLAKSNGNLP
jgi:hypothetical protein